MNIKLNFLKVLKKQYYNGDWVNENIEKKWQKKWKESKLFKSNPNDKEKLYLTVAFPYPSGAMHIGHGRTYTVPDVYARFKRMKGFNVLFPMAV